MKIEGVKVISVKINSPYFNYIKENDIIIKIGKYTVFDILDLYFYFDEAKSIKIKRGEKVFSLPLIDTFFDDLEFHPPSIIRCKNKCIFCFVDQMPEGFRKSLYIKDDDYRYSFLNGNFITLTNLNRFHLNRIIKLHLSPLYVTINSLQKNTRKFLMGEYAANYPVLKVLDHFLKNNINLHLQFVICPYINDFPDLENSLTKLTKYEKIIRSIGIIPVGITKYQKNRSLKNIDREYSRIFIKKISDFAKKSPFYKRIQLADEWFIKAGYPIPKKEYYLTDFEELYPQYENGIGLTRCFIDEIKKYRKLIKKAKYTEIGIITSKSNIYLWHRIKNLLKKYIKITTYIVENTIFGENITVSGLICGKDVLEKIKEIKEKVIFLPENALRKNLYFLDNISLNTIIKESNKRVEVVRSGREFIEKLFHVKQSPSKVSRET